MLPSVLSLHLHNAATYLHDIHLLILGSQQEDPGVTVKTEDTMAVSKCSVMETEWPVETWGLTLAPL